MTKPLGTWLCPESLLSSVQGARRHGMGTVFAVAMAEHRSGFRPGRGDKDALRRVDHLRKRGSDWVVAADLKSYFDTIPHDRLFACVQPRVADGRVLRRVESLLRAGVLEPAQGWQPTARGTPQGGGNSPLLTNGYLNPLDHQRAAAGGELVRYADDFGILCRREAEAQAALAAVQQWGIKAGLTLPPEKTRIVNAAQPGGFDFRGNHFARGLKWPRKKSLGKLKDRVRAHPRGWTGGSWPTS